ncbi:MAG: ATP-binding cassette domain-containing protein [Archaeoglobaceae archaeon]|nr:ATP-binding cassette domain-containing protein [Archaeoglobaceae archaeon]MCX8151899.1 ATP-binding cassette domain-containing protein [Archaeoglobaceae archaeon]MDW8013288.1 ATP-binding cassette domain-containing protein [Archaeoglobaceae archaeon]
MKAVVVENLVKDFGNFRAIDCVSFEVEEGEVFGILGPNGAGKTTTIKILITLLKPTKGRAFVAGYDVLKSASDVRKNIGVVFQETTLELEFTARENLDFHARLYGMSKAEREKRIEEMLNLVELESFSDKLVKTFSGGMKRRLEIARGFLHNPKILFLDEPTLGLDAKTRRKIWKYIEELKGSSTIVLTTHYIEEAEKLCDRIVVMNKGKIVAMDSPKNLKAEDRVVIYSSKEDLDLIKKNFGSLIVSEDDGKVELLVKDVESFIPKLFEVAKVKEMSIKRSTLEDAYIKMVE